jgi:hypothetical protein
VVWLINDQSPFVMALLFTLAMLGGWWIGHRIGALRRGQDLAAEANKLNDAILALMGLLLAFTFSMSLSRHEQRRLMAVQDSNSIGDFLTCVRLLDPPVRTRLEETLRRYLAARLAIAGADPTPEQFDERLGEFEGLHDEMLAQVDKAIRSSTPIVVPLVNTLNEVTSSHASRLSAYRDRLPVSIVLTLLVAAVVSLVNTGFREGVSNTWRPGPTIGFAVLVSMVVGVTLDLNQPQQGWIRVSQEPLERLAKSLELKTAPP